MRSLPVPPKPVRSTLLAALVGALLAPAAPAAVLTQVSTGCVDSVGFIRDENTSADSAISDCSFAVANAVHTGNGSASVQLRVGERRVGVEARALASSTLKDLPIATTLARASGQVTLTDSFDAVAKDGEGRTVAEGFATVSVLASGRLSFEASGGALNDNSGAELIYLFDLSPGGSAVDKHLTLQTSGSLPAGAVLNHRIHWFAGDTLQLHMEVQARASVYILNAGQGNAAVNFGNSLDWLGVSDVTDLAGRPVAQFSLVSASTGVDWAPMEAVPEPAIWQLLGLALGGAWLRRRLGWLRGS